MAPGHSLRAEGSLGPDQDLSVDSPADAPAFDSVELVEGDELLALEAPFSESREPEPLEPEPLEPERLEPLEPPEPTGAVDELDPSVRAESADVRLPFPEPPLLDEELLRESVL